MKYFSGGITDANIPFSPIKGKGILGKGFMVVVALMIANPLHQSKSALAQSKEAGTQKIGVQAQDSITSQKSIKNIRIIFAAAEKKQWLAYLDSKEKFLRKSAIIMWGLVRTEPKTVLPKLIEKLKDDDKEIKYLATEVIKQYGKSAKDSILREFSAENIGISDFYGIYKDIGLKESDLDVLFEKYDHVSGLSSILEGELYLEIVKSIIPKESEIANYFLKRIMNALRNPGNYENDLFSNYVWMFDRLGQSSMEQVLVILRNGRFEERIIAATLISVIGMNYGDFLPELEKAAQLRINNDIRDLLKPIVRKIKEDIRTKLIEDEEAKKREEVLKEWNNLKKGLSTAIGVRSPSKPKFMDFELHRIVDFFIGGLARKDEINQSVSYSALKKIGKPAFPQLVQALGTKPPFNSFRRYSYSQRASEARKFLKSSGDVIIPYLIDAIYITDNGRLFNAAVQLLSNFDYEPQAEKGKIVYYFVTEADSFSSYSSEDKKGRQKLPEVGSAAIPFLLRVAQMDGIGSYADAYAIGALGSLGKDAMGVLPELERLLKTGKFTWHMDDYYSTVSKIGGEKALEILIKGLSRDDLEWYTKSTIMLGMKKGFGFDNEKVLNVFKLMAKNDDMHIRISAYADLSDDKFFEKPGVDQIFLEGLDDSDNLVKFNVINFLESRGEKATFALQKLKEIIDDHETEENLGGFNLRAAAKEAYRSIKNSTDKSISPKGKGNG
ncbi:hypothetical protein KA005_48550 [bacterium]|nr:hypothetical protein [bacterium]